MALNIAGLILTILFYLLVLGIGIWASVKSKKMQSNTQGQVEVSLLGSRSVSLIVGVFTMTATWVGGGFIIGTAELVYDPTKGLVWALIPLQSSIAFIIRHSDRSIKKVAVRREEEMKGEVGRSSPIT